MTTLFEKAAAPLVAAWDWWVVNLAALAADDESIPHATPSPMWWGELLNPPLED